MTIPLRWNGLSVLSLIPNTLGGEAVVNTHALAMDRLVEAYGFALRLRDFDEGLSYWYCKKIEDMVELVDLAHLVGGVHTKEAAALHGEIRHALALWVEASSFGLR